MRSRYLLLVWFAAAAIAYAQTGPCTESAVLKGALPAADNAFSYMPVYSKPAETKTAADQANEDSFADRINRKFEWADDHHVGASPSGDMAYEHGTMHVSYDTKSDGKHHSFDAVMLIVYEAKGSVCQQVAMTMYPLEDTVK
jgi:ketosteroid isomerase-like protein